MLDSGTASTEQLRYAAVVHLICLVACAIEHLQVETYYHNYTFDHGDRLGKTKKRKNRRSAEKST